MLRRNDRDKIKTLGLPGISEKLSILFLPYQALSLVFFLDVKSLTLKLPSSPWMTIVKFLCHLSGFSLNILVFPYASAQSLGMLSSSEADSNEPNIGPANLTFVFNTPFRPFIPHLSVCLSTDHQRGPPVCHSTYNQSDPPVSLSTDNQRNPSSCSAGHGTTSRELGLWRSRRGALCRLCHRSCVRCRIYSYHFRDWDRSRASVSRPWCRCLCGVW